MEIVELLHRYALAIDTPDWSLLPTVFTRDARVDFGSVDRYVESEAAAEGLDAIRAWLEGALAPFPDVLHFMTNHVVEVDGDEARTQTLMHVLNMGIGGVYRGHAVRTAEGWRLARLTLEERSFDEAADRLRAHIDSIDSAGPPSAGPAAAADGEPRVQRAEAMLDRIFTCLLYTSDAADE